MRVSDRLQELKRQWQRFFDTAPKPAACVFCGGTRLWWNGVRVRSASVRVDDAVHYVDEIACRRVKCAAAGCAKSWTLRPPGLVPQRHYQLCVVAEATGRYLFEAHSSQSQLARECTCSRKSVRRWVDWVAGLAAPAELYRHLLAVTGEPLTVVLRSIAETGRQALGEARRAVLDRAGQVLCLVEALAAALGWEPPGLRSVVEAVVADRYGVTTDAAPRLPELARRLSWLGWGRPCPYAWHRQPTR